MKKTLRISLVVIVALLIITLWMLYHRSATHANWQPVKQGPIVSAIYGLGTVKAEKIYRLEVGVISHVKKLYVREGDDVQKDQPLIEFDNLPQYKAPFSGTITSLPLHVNETVYPQTEVLLLMDLADRYVLVSLEQEAAMKIHKGQKVRLSFSGLPNQVFNGVVSTVYPKDQESYAKIMVTQLPASILPQMSSDVAIVIDEKANALSIPIQALHNSAVTIRRLGKTQQIVVEVGAMNEDYIEVLSNNIQAQDEVWVKI